MRAKRLHFLVPARRDMRRDEGVLNWVDNSASGVERSCDGRRYKEAQLAADDFRHSHYDGIPPSLSGRPTVIGEFLPTDPERRTTENHSVADLPPPLSGRRNKRQAQLQNIIIPVVGVLASVR